MNATVSQSGTLKAEVKTQVSLNGQMKAQTELNGYASKPEMLYVGALLPNVTEEDDGKVLKVRDGQWSKGLDETAEALTNSEIEELLNNFV